MWSHIYGLDIETDTTPETEAELAAGYAPGNRGLDPRIGAVINAAVAHADGVEVFRGSEHDVLNKLAHFLYDAPVGLIATWNGAVFDMPFLFDRNHFARTGWNTPRLTPDPLIVPKYDPLPGHAGGYHVQWPCRGGAHAHLDVAYALKAKAAELGVAWSLKPVMKALGVPMVEVDRTKIHLLTPEEQDAYVASDAAGARVAAIGLLSAAL